MKEIFDFSGISLEKMLSTASATPRQTDTDCISDMPIAMAYVPIQQYKKTYEPDSGLTFGTIFPELNKPFCGCNNGWGDNR